jgi:prolyl-tRNA editing enzyme YbaK/EbsC (Cys-tRNA(Pro) deacylase)
LSTFCDRRLGNHEKINFNAGDHSISVSMGFSDYLRIEQPTLGEWAASGA